MPASSTVERGARFPRNQRLLQSSDYRLVMSTNLRSNDHLFRMFARENGEQLGRLGLTVSRRAASKAVDRNRIKRVIRESFRHKQGALTGLNIVAIATMGSKTATNRVLFASLERHWQNICSKRKCAE